MKSPGEILALGTAELGIVLSEHQLEEFDRFTALLLEWNERLNLTRITEPTEIATKHYLDSLSLLRYVKPGDGDAVIDVGTGAGIPGIPLKIAVPGIKLTLLDSVAKKLAFADAVAKEMGLSGVRTLHARAEDAGRDKVLREKFDIVVSRAVSRLAGLVELCLPLCKVGGVFAAYKGPGAGEEITEAGKAIKALGGKLEAVHEFTLPHSDAERTLILIRRTRRTSNTYPRKPGIPTKEPVL